MADKLKECPFCGGEAKSWHNNTGGITVGCVSNRCRIAPTISTFDRDIRNAENEAIEAWNERNNWHTGTPTEECIDEDNEYCFALMFFYDKWWLSDYLFKANFEEGCFETAPKDGLEVVKFRFDEKLMWQKIESFKEENNGFID